MNIGICLRTWGDKGGIGIYSRNLIEALLALDIKNQYVLFYNNRAHLGQFSYYKNVKELYVSAPGKLLWDQMVIPYYAAREHVTLLFHTKFTVPLLAPCKTVTVLHGSERFVYPQFSHKSDILYFKMIYPYYLRRATALISVSENVRKDIIRFININPEKVKTIHLSANDIFRKIDDLYFLESIREKYALPNRFILNIGLIYPGKNIPNLLKAFKLVRQKEDIKLVIVGSGRRMYSQDLELIQEFGLQEDVFLPGYIDQQDLVAVYNLAELFAFPSLYEGFGIPILESMACGCPVIASKTGSLPEIAGDAAQYVTPWDVEDIAQAICRVLADSHFRQELIQRGFEQAQRFSWATCARQTLQVFEEIAGDNLSRAT